VPKGVVHDRIALLLSLPTLCISNYILKDFGLAATLTLSSLLSAFMLSPDLDTKSFSYYRWNVFRFIWLPYRKLIPHRSRFSHSFLLAPILKILYLFLIFLLVLAIITLLLNIFGFSLSFFALKLAILNNLKSYLPYIYVILIGLLWANAQHNFADIVLSRFKKMFKI